MHRTINLIGDITVINPRSLYRKIAEIKRQHADGKPLEEYEKRLVLAIVNTHPATVKRFGSKAVDVRVETGRERTAFFEIKTADSDWIRIRERPYLVYAEVMTRIAV